MAQKNYKNANQTYNNNTSKLGLSNLLYNITSKLNTGDAGLKKSTENAQQNSVQQNALANQQAQQYAQQQNALANAEAQKYAQQQANATAQNTTNAVRSSARNSGMSKAQAAALGSQATANAFDDAYANAYQSQMNQANGNYANQQGSANSNYNIQQNNAMTMQNAAVNAEQQNVANQQQMVTNAQTQEQIGQQQDNDRFNRGWGTASGILNTAGTVLKGITSFSDERLKNYREVSSRICSDRGLKNYKNLVWTPSENEDVNTIGSGSDLDNEEDFKKSGPHQMHSTMFSDERLKKYHEISRKLCCKSPNAYESLKVVVRGN